MTKIARSRKEKGWTRASVWLLGGILVLGAGSAWGQAEQSEDDADSRTNLYSGLIESRELRRGKIRLAREQWAFTMLGSAAGVYDSNVFQAPDAQDAGFGNFALGATVRRKFEGYGRLKLEVAGGAAPYSRDSDVLNEYGAKAKVGYTHRFSGDLSGRVFAAVKYSNDHATTINGNPFLRDFEYVSYRVGPSVNQAIGEVGELRFAYEAKRKDYSETPALPSLDWWRHRVDTRYRAFLGAFAHVDFEYRFSLQQYDEEPSQTSSGGPTRTPEEHFFHRLGVDGTWNAAPWVEVIGGYRFKRKDDRFEGYESYDSHRLALAAELAATPQLAFELGTTLEFRDYDNRRASLTNNTTLEWDKLTFFTNAIFNFTKHVAGWAGYSFIDRDSNRTYGTSFRSYREHKLFMGVTMAY